MTSTTHSRLVFRFAFIALLVFASGLAINQRAANGQQLLLDFTTNGSDINSPTLTASGTSGGTETITVWAVETTGTASGSNLNTDLGVEYLYWAARASVGGSGFTNLGAGSTTGAVYNVGVTSAALATGSLSGLSGSGAGFGTSNAAIGDWTSSQVNEMTTTTKTKADIAFATTGGGVIMAGGSSGEALAGTNTGWAWQLGTMTVTLPTVTSGSQTLTFTPSPTGLTSLAADWTSNGNTSDVSTAVVAGADAVTFTVHPAASSNSSVLALSPSALTFGLMTNAPAPATQNLSLQETTGSSGNNASYTGTSVNGFSIANGASGTVNAGATNLLAVGYTGSTATAGTFSGTYTVSNTSGSSATQGNLSATITAIVGNAAADVSGNGTFGGSQMMAGIAQGANYATPADPLSAKAATSFVGNGTGGGGLEGSVAQILMGTNSGNWITGNGGTANVGITFRNRMLTETPGNDSVNGNGFPNGTPTSPPLSGLPLISDVARLYGMNSNATASTSASVQTDPFVFEMSFNPATLLAEGATPADLATRGNVYLASLLGGTWQNTINADFSAGEATTTTNATKDGTTINVGIDAAAAMPNGNFTRPYIGTFAAWEGQNPGFNSSDVADYIGVYGVDPNGDNAWAIINHNSDFAVVPEPSTIVLAGLGLIGAAFALRRRRRLEA